MRRYICLAIIMFLLAGCTSTPADNPENPEKAQTPAASDSAAAAPPSGKWSGDYGPNPDRREPITVELRWEGTDLRGTVLAGSRDLDLTRASFKPESGAIIMEFDAQGNNGQAVHYTIEGKVEGNKMSGTWSHPAMRGDFEVTRR